MVLYTGLWNNKSRSLNEQESCDYNDNNNNNNKETSSPSSSPINDYGSILSYGGNNSNNTFNFNFLSSQNQNYENGGIVEKTITWDDGIDLEQGRQHRFSGGGGGGGTKENYNYNGGGGGGDAYDENTVVTSSTTNSETSNSWDSSAQELPSLTGAFQSVENRPILLNCLWYLMIYFLMAIAAYSYIFEHWTIIDSMYFAVSTFTTCGYGDLEPTTEPGQIFTILFAIYGVIILGVFIGIFGNFISQTQNQTMRKFKKHQQKQMLNTLFRSQHSERGVGKVYQTPIEETGFWRDHISLADDVWGVVQSEFPSILLVAVMAIFLGYREQWTLTSTIYFSIMAATTTGYGDYTPTNQADKLYSVIFLPLAVAVFGEVLGRIATVYIQRKQRVAEQKFLHRSLTLCDIRNMDTNDDGAVDREDFVTFMLIALQKVDRGTIKELRDIFDSLDSNGNGLLEAEDLIELAEETYLPTLHRVGQEYHQMSSSEINHMLMEKEITSRKAKQAHRRVHTVM